MAGYFYVLQAVDTAEIVAYHWHSASAGSIAFQHMHVGVGATGTNTPILTGRFHKAHFPTGPIEIEDVIQLAIVEFGARPRRPDWAAVLDATRRMRSNT